MSDDDRDYYYRRAEQEIALAQASRNEEAVRVHYCLAGLYLDRVFGDAPQDFRPDPAQAAIGLN